jgi:D-alanine-D-alanine ligase
MKVGVLYGGDSPEREVSLNSGLAVCSALKEAGYAVSPFRIDKAEEAIALLGSGWDGFFFIALHGGWGEDGRLQALLELAGRPYSGSGPSACFCAMDKEVSKALFRERGVPTPPGITLAKEDRILKEKRDGVEALLGIGKHLVVKPSGCGSTVGVSIVSSLSELEEAVATAREFDEKVIVESYIEGRELTVSVIEEKGVATVLPVVEILPPSGFYTYEAKYTPGASRYEAPASLSAREKAAVDASALAAHRSLGCRVYSRVDVRLDEGGNPFVLEVNTAPGMTSTSLVPKAAKAAGIEFPELLRRIVEASVR